jgi:hypothetical protein
MNGILDCEKRGLSPFLQPAALRCARFVKVFFMSISLIGLGTWGSGAMAATCTATTAAPQPRLWSAVATWSCGHVPINNDGVVIPSGATVTLDVNTNRLTDLTINSGGTLQGDNTNKILTMNNGTGVDITNNGTIDFGTGKLATIFTRQSSQWAGNSGTWNLSTIDLNSNTLTFSAGSTMTINMSGAASPFLNAGTVTSLSTVTWNFSGSVAQTLPASANVWYGNVTVSNTAGTTLGANLTTTNILGNLTVASNGILNNGGFSATLNAGKSFAVQANAQFNLTGTSTMVAVSGGGTKTFNATSTVNYGGTNQTVTAETYGNLTLSGSGTKTMPATAMTIASDFTMTGTATATAAAALTVGSDFSIGASNTFANGANALSVAGNFAQNGTFTAGAGVVTLNGGAAVQTISGTGTLGFANLTVSNTGGITLARNVTVTAAIIGTVTLTSTCPVDYTLTSNGGATVQHSCPLDHLLIQHATGTGLTCAASTLTVVACQDAACSSFYTGGISGTLSAAGAPTVNWDGTTGGAAGAGFVISSGSSSVTKNVQVATAGTVTFGVSAAIPAPPSATTCNFGAPACTFTASTAGFIFSDTTTGNTYAIPAQVSGIATSTLYLRAVQASTTNPAVCTPAIISSTTSVNMGYTCNNPASCQAGNLATITNTTTSTSTAIAPGGTAVSLSFDANGSAPITVRYDDAGQITLNNSLTVTPFGGATAITLTGSSNAYVVAPHHFGFSGVTAAPIKAGNNFDATVTAYNGLATPTVTANFGQEGTAAGVTLSFTKCQPTDTGLPVVTSVGNFTGNVGAFTAGVASASNLNWSEVGNGDLTATLTGGSYLGSLLTATGNTGTGGTTCNTGGAGNVGRFIPDHFITAVTDGCPGSGFTYSGQPFTIAVTAMNGLVLPTTTVNYDGTANTSPNFSKAVTTTAWDAATGLISNPGGALTNTSVTAADFTQGVATINATNVGPATLAPIFTFTTRATAPTSIRVRAVDTDTVSSSTFTEGTTGIRSGRAKLGNAHGSELLALPIPFRTEYWNSGWVSNPADSCSGDGSSGGTVSLSLSASPSTCVQDTGNPGLSGAGCVAAGPSAQRYTEGSVAGFAGNFNVWLKATGHNNTGAVTVTGNVPDWLKYPWGGAAAINPSSRATFGVYKGSTEFIYMRENY